MYAVLKTGGKQYRVEPGMQLEVEKLDGEIGSSVRFENVLLLANDKDIHVGKPQVANAVVVAKIVAQKKGPKVIIFKKLKRHGRRLKKGHRQGLTRVEVQDIQLG